MPPPDSILTPPPAAGTTTPTAGPASAGTTPPASQAGTAPTSSAAPAGGPAAPWYPEAHKGFMEGKGNPDPATFVESYINLEKLVGADPKTILRLPKDGDAESQAKFYNALGRPETPDKYTTVEALKDDPLSKAMAPIAHELGLTDKQWSGLQAKLLEQTGKLNEGLATQTEAEAKAHHDKRMAALKADLGEKYPETLADAHRAVSTAVPETYKDPATGKVWTAAEINGAIEGALGADLALRIFANLGKYQAEDRTISGTAPASGVMTPDAAQARWNMLQADKGWSQRYMAGGVEERREAERLAGIIAAGKTAA